LAVVGTFAPTAMGTAFVALGALALRSREVVLIVRILAIGHYLRPLDGPHVAEIVVVVETHLTIKDVSQIGNLQRVHLGVGDEEGILLLLHGQTEQCAAANDLQSEMGIIINNYY